jgi:hypothetical protein
LKGEVETTLARKALSLRATHEIATDLLPCPP